MWASLAKHKVQQLGFRRLARVRDRVVDATTPLVNLLVRCTCQFPRHLVAPVPAENSVGVRVHKPWDTTPSGVLTLGVGGWGRQVAKGQRPIVVAVAQRRAKRAPKCALCTAKVIGATRNTALHMVGGSAHKAIGVKMLSHQEGRICRCSPLHAAQGRAGPSSCSCLWTAQWQQSFQRGPLAWSGSRAPRPS